MKILSSDRSASHGTRGRPGINPSLVDAKCAAPDGTPILFASDSTKMPPRWGCRWQMAGGRRQMADLRSQISDRRSGRRRGVALVVTLIMLSVITVVAVTFLAMSRRERSSVTQTLNSTDAKTMADAALERAKGQIMAP